MVALFGHAIFLSGREALSKLWTYTDPQVCPACMGSLSRPERGDFLRNWLKRPSDHFTSITLADLNAAFVLLCQSDAPNLFGT